MVSCSYKTPTGSAMSSLILSIENLHPFLLLHWMWRYSERPSATVLLSAWHFCTYNIHWESFQYETFIASVVGALFPAYSQHFQSHSVFRTCSPWDVKAMSNEHQVPWKRMSFITHSITFDFCFSGTHELFCPHRSNQCCKKNGFPTQFLHWEQVGFCQNINRYCSWY